MLKRLRHELFNEHSRSHDIAVSILWGIFWLAAIIIFLAVVISDPCPFGFLSYPCK